MSDWEDITDMLTPTGRNLKVGRVLIFDYEGLPINLKIVRKRHGKVWAKPITLYSEDEFRKKLR